MSGEGYRVAHGHRGQVHLSAPQGHGGLRWTGNSVLVHPRQKGNPILKYIRNVQWEYCDEIVPDYMMGQSSAGVFLSLRYHLLKPEYVHSRMKALRGSGIRLKVLLVQIDTEDAAVPLGQVTKAAVGNDFTLLCGFTPAECARYIEILKSYEKKPAESIRRDLGSDYATRATSVLTAVRGVNRTDSKTLGDCRGSMAEIFQSSLKDLQSCAGIGSTKARRLHEAFHAPFFRKDAIIANGGATSKDDGKNIMVEAHDQRDEQTKMVDTNAEALVVVPGVEHDDDKEDDSDDYE